MKTSIPKMQNVPIGNFGSPKRTREAYNSGIGVTNAKVVKITTKDEYLNRLYTAFDATTDPKLKKFIFEEIRKILIRNNKWAEGSFQTVH